MFEMFYLMSTTQSRSQLSGSDLTGSVCLFMCSAAEGEQPPVGLFLLQLNV